MGIYKTLYGFQNIFYSPIGESGCCPWSKGFPLTTQIPIGLKIPTQVNINSRDLMNPKVWRQPQLLKKSPNIITITILKSNPNSNNISV